VPDAPLRDIAEILATRVPDVAFEQQALEEVMRWVEQQTGATVYVRWQVLEDAGIPRDAPVTLTARNRQLAHILALILKEAEGESGTRLAYEASSELFVVSTHDDLSRALITRVYDVERLLQDIPKFDMPPGVIAPGVGGKALPNLPTRVVRPGPGQSAGGEATPVGGAPTVVVEDERERELVDLITLNVEPESWQINGQGGRGTIFPRDGKLIIRNSRHVHQLLAGLLDEPRR
jgi:hypothetical protein